MPAMRTESASFIAHGLVWFRREAEERRGGWLAWGNLLLSFFFVLALVHGVVLKNVGSLFFILLFLRSIYPHWILGVPLLTVV